MTIPHAEPKYERQIRAQNHRIVVLNYVDAHKFISLKICQKELGMTKAVAEHSLRHLMLSGHLKQKIVNSKATYTRTKKEFVPIVFAPKPKPVKEVKVKEVIPKVEDTRTVVKVNAHTTQYFLSRRKQEPVPKKHRPKRSTDYGIRSNMYMFDGV